ncbi:LYAR-type C2HC zinc finger domain containing protein [Nitzschia inconspicua]|uniref:LYAR-type C2HC zinc finger domain containing protein n=1 Tax=Nitzschia inconspicua TaxID=303405 RepID=A0A9K3LSK6_9STRA|nr:LYAR-type C2HC zinc finger domain containing protein [Nitzschia inconspicua]
MVFFSCDGCGDMLKKNQVDAHVFRCKNGCHAVSCVDCSVSFYGDDYKAHTSCMTEAERYEKKPSSSSKTKKRNPQQEWMDVVDTCATAGSDDLSTSHKNPHLQSYLKTMAGLDNIPRKEKQFLNFMANSLNLRGRQGTDICQQLWNILKQEKEKRMANKPNQSSSSTSTTTTTTRDTQQQQQQQPQKVEEDDSDKEGETNTTETKGSATSTTTNTQTDPTTVTTHQQTKRRDDSESNNNNKNNDTVDTKKVHKAMKKALKKAPNRSMKVKALCKVLSKDYGIDAKKSQLQQIVGSYKKAKIDGKTISLVVS